MISEIEDLESIRIGHSEAGKELLKISSGRLFPCHSLYLAILNRSIELFDGFVLLAKNNNYGCCMALLRMQLDNILRFNGVLQSDDIHETAHRILNGEWLSRIKDTKGIFLKDFYLKELLTKDTSLDAFWLDPTEWADNDNDGIGNNGDIDDDNDGVSDALEADMGTSPNVANSFAGKVKLDSDGDGLPDTLEASVGSNTAQADSDGDGISDTLELIQYITNPMSSDTDGDTIPDNIDPEPGVGACTMPLNGLYKGSVIGDGVGL